MHPEERVEDVVHERRSRYERWWIVGIVAFTLGRFVVAYSTLREYDLNIWFFGFVDLATAVPYAVGTARLVTSSIDHQWRAATWWMAVAAASFLAPYAYIALAGEGMPAVVYVVLALLVGALGTNAVLGIRKKIVAGRLAKADEDHPPTPR